MEREQYDLMFRQEDRHWWYVGMRQISLSLLRSYPPKTSPVGRGRGSGWEILDAGCGSGGTTSFLGRFGPVTGVDLAAAAVELAKLRGVASVVRGSVDRLPLRDTSFDLATSFDVLYHLDVQDDAIALRELHRVVRPGGVVLIRVPAYDWIRGAHDQAVHTRHRYTLRELSTKLEGAGLRVEHASYANSLLFPLAPAKRLLEQRNGGGKATDLWRPPGPLNRFLGQLLSAEAPWVASRHLPWGLSVFAVGRRI